METKRVHEVVHDLRQKPMHVRENMALGIAGGLTLLVALGWFGVATATGTFSFSSHATLADTSALPAAPAKTNVSELLGAAGAAFGATSSAPQIQVVDTQVHSTLDQNTVSPNATVIHF